MIHCPDFLNDRDYREKLMRGIIMGWELRGGNGIRQIVQLGGHDKEQMVKPFSL
jgi:hypothetical protein